jgi:Cadherin-like
MNGKARKSVTAVDSAITATEDTPYTFKVADFGFSAAVAADTLASVTITSLPSDGTLALNGTAIADGQFITAAELNAGDLTFVPNTGSTTAGSFQFQVTDSLRNRLSSNTATMDITITPPPAIPPSTGPTLDARQFSTVTHAGTVSDPWPGTAILSALMALPATGGTVMVADGVWKIDSLLQVNGVNNFNLVGQSLNAQLMFTGAGQMWFGSAGGGIGGVSNATISTLTINANTLTMASPQSAMRISNAQNVSFNNNQILGHQNSSISAVFFEGGSNNQFLNNTITAGPQGGAPLQLQTLGGTPNSGFVVSQNTFDSSNLLLIGLNNTKVTNNYFSNRTLGNSIGIEIIGPYSGTSQNITIDGNTLDASIVPGHENGVLISGYPQDPGGTSNIDGLSITNNILKGTRSLIAVQSLDPSNFTDNSLIGSNKTNVTITGNQLSSLWAGSTIDIRGGAGSVDKVLVQSNTLQNSAGAQNLITEDAHTTNATILLNQGANVFEVNDGGSPLISSGVANSNTDPMVTLTGTAPAGSTVTVSDGGSTHPAPPNAPDVALLGNYMASSFAMAGYNYGGTIVSREDVESHDPLLAGSQHG